MCRLVVKSVLVMFSSILLILCFERLLDQLSPIPVDLQSIFETSRYHYHEHIGLQTRALK